MLPIGAAIGGVTRKFKGTALRLFSRGKNTIPGENVSPGQTPTKPDGRRRLGARPGASGVHDLSDTAQSEISSAANAPSPPSLAALTLEDQLQPAPLGFTAWSALPRTDSGYVSASDQHLPALNARHECVDETPLFSARRSGHGGVDDADDATKSSARTAIPQADARHDQFGISYTSGTAKRSERSIGLTRRAALPGAIPHVSRAIRSMTDREPLARMPRDVAVHSVRKPR